MLLALSFVACDEDTETAIRLEGEWTGDFGMYSIAQQYDRYGRPMYDAYGYPITVTYDAEYSNIRFYWDGGSHGHGEQIDFYRYGPYRWQSYYFVWQVNNGVLYMKYNYDHQLDCAIYDYYMDYNYFTGRIGNSNGGYTNFKLFKLSDFNSWNRYDRATYYGYEYYDDYIGYYVKGRDSQPLADTAQDVGEVRIIGRGNRFANQQQEEE